MIVFPHPTDVSLSPLAEADAGGRGLFRVNTEILIHIRLWAVQILLLRIPVGFVTDGGSIPRWARWRFDPWGKAGLAYILHDGLFYLTLLPKWLIDALFLIALRVCGIGATEATALYLAARSRPRRSTDVARFA